VIAYGGCRRPPRPVDFEIAFCDLKVACSSFGQPEHDVVGEAVGVAPECLDESPNAARTMRLIHADRGTLNVRIQEAEYEPAVNMQAIPAVAATYCAAKSASLAGPWKSEKGSYTALATVQ
jgi:hypothetical protein